MSPRTKCSPVEELRNWWWNVDRGLLMLLGGAVIGHSPQAGWNRAAGKRGNVRFIKEPGTSEFHLTHVWHPKSFQPVQLGHRP